MTDDIKKETPLPKKDAREWGSRWLKVILQWNIYYIIMKYNVHYTEFQINDIYYAPD